MQLRERAQEDGFADDRLFVIDDDMGLSGRRIDKRPGFSRALDMIERGGVAAIYVEDLTRLSRDERTVDQMIIADACERSGTLIYMGRSWYDMRDSGQRQSYKYQAVGFSEYWKSHMTKLHDTQRQKALKGKTVTQLPRGYLPNRSVNKRDPDYDRPILYEPEAEIIRGVVASLSVAGSIRGALRLAPLEWPDGKRIWRSQMTKLLKSPFLRGHFVWGDIIIPNSHEALITPEQAALIERLCEVNRETRRRHATDGGVLAGLVWCAKCKKKLRCNRRGRSSSYHCRGHYQIGMATIDEAIGEIVSAELKTGMIDRVIDVLAERKGKIVSFAVGIESRRKSLQKVVANLTRTLSFDEIPDQTRKHVALELDAALKDLRLLESGPDVTRLEGDISTLEGLKHHELLTVLALDWHRQDVSWRRVFVRQFLDRVDVRQDEISWHIQIALKTGEVLSKTISRKPGWSDKELSLLKDLWNDEDRPIYGYCDWMIERLLEAGYTRSRSAIYHATASFRLELPIRG